MTPSQELYDAVYEIMLSAVGSPGEAEAEAEALNVSRARQLTSEMLLVFSKHS